MAKTAKKGHWQRVWVKGMAEGIGKGYGRRGMGGRALAKGMGEGHWRRVWAKGIGEGYGQRVWAKGMAKGIGEGYGKSGMFQKIFLFLLRFS